jgi:hypothetical protein
MDGTPVHYLIIHSNLEGEAQLVTEALLLGNVRADFP